MERWMQVLGWMMLSQLMGWGQESVPVEWAGLRVTQSRFSERLVMMATEREDYASTLADCAARRLAKGGQMVEDGRKLWDLAVQLSPRNERVAWVNRQMVKGESLVRRDGNYQDGGAAKLLWVRARILEHQGGEENLRMARYFYEAAKILDPWNRKLAQEVDDLRKKYGQVDWDWLKTEGAKPKIEGEGKKMDGNLAN